MSTAIGRPLAAELRHRLTSFQGNWRWFLILGIGLLALGFVALCSAGTTALATATILGVLMVISGFGEFIGSMWCREWSGFFSHLLSAILSIIVGMMFLRAPAGSLAAITMLLACLLMVGGIFKVVAAASYRFTGWVWPLMGGIIDFLLGVLIWQEWPASGLWVVGMFVGINLLMRGFNWINLALFLKRLPSTTLQ